ncbi:glycosyltransferase family 48 protein [Scleroderma citrinum Foug A]|uniref:Glycosyltransferase family 48 protein n=1 Tax=Scleroderma citrinum Foug A TaxID=1036808 RepID=A0A0C3D4E1_9AGAM|nr:glycosyltransferase family 48 protein [Scleroderma citrinum Foug A]
MNGYYNLIPVLDWIHWCIISIFLVWMIAFLPLFFQELVECVGKQFLSLSPIFKVFSTQIYTHSIISNLSFALLYVMMAMWMLYLIYFWFSILALCIAPFLFNPHQFSFSGFIAITENVPCSSEFLRWMSRGNSRSHMNSWIGYYRLSRTMFGDVPRAG